MTEQTDAAEAVRDPRVPTFLVLRGLDGSEMPHPDPAGWLAAREAAARDRGNLEAYRYVHRLLGDGSHEVIEEHVASALAAAEARGAQAVLAAVEAELSAEEERLAPFGPDPSGLLGNWLGGIRVARDAARAAAAAAGGGV